MRVSLEHGGRVLLVEAPGTYSYVSTLPPGRGESRLYGFIHVPEDYRIPEDSLGAALEREAASLGLPPGTPVFLTAARLEDHHWVVEGEGFSVVATVGLTPPTCPGGGGVVYDPVPATINVLVLVHGGLSLSGALDLLRVVAEAKAAGAWEALLRCEGSPPWRPVGTVSDAVMVAWASPGGAGVAGHGTRLGASVGLAVYNIIVEAGTRERLWYVERSLGHGIDGLARVVGELYEQAPVPGVSREWVEAEARRMLESWLGDPNVASLIVAARELDVRGSSGALPGLSVEEFRGDSVRLLADDILGMALAEYLAGTRGVFTLVWAERLKKEGVIPELEPFSDDVLTALAASALTRILDRLLG